MKKQLLIISIIMFTVLLVNTCYSQKTTKDTYPSFILNHQSTGEKIKIYVVAENVPLEYFILPAFSKVLNFNFTIKPSKHYKTTIVYINGEYPKEEIWGMFIKLLKISNAAYKVEGNLISIYPDKKGNEAVAGQPKDNKAVIKTETEQKKKHSFGGRKSAAELKKIRQEILKRMMEAKKKKDNE
jgi:hypothetical protein